MVFHILKENVIASQAGEFATLDGGNILSESAPQMWTGRRAFWSGWMGETVFARDHRTWSREAWTRLDAWCDRVLPGLTASRATACLRPHPRHVLSDAQSCVSFLKRRQGQPFEILLDPAGLLTKAMLGRAEDHLLRAIDALGGLESVAGVVIANVQSLRDGEDLLAPAEVDAGLLEVALVKMIHARAPIEKPRILVGDDAERQAALLLD